LRSPPASVNIAPVAHDLIISGAGPAGISTAVEAREGGNRARPDPHPGKRTCTLRRDPQVLPGGTIQRWELNVQYDEGAQTIRKHEDRQLFDVATGKASCQAKVAVMICRDYLDRPMAAEPQRA
jgi:flavin-dependent dehydrogenase